MKHLARELYWKRFLLPGEKIIHTFGVSRRYIWLYWVLPALVLLVLALVMGVSNILLGGMLALLSLGLLVPILYLTFFVHYIITNRRVMSREGVLHKRFVTVDMRSITDIYIHESLLERLFTRTGVIGVNTAGSHHVELYFRHITHPLERRGDIYKHAHEVTGHADQHPRVRRSSV